MGEEEIGGKMGAEPVLMAGAVPKWPSSGGFRGAASPGAAAMNAMEQCWQMVRVWFVVLADRVLL